MVVRGYTNQPSTLILGHCGSVYILSCNMPGLGTRKNLASVEVERIEKNFKVGLSSLLFCFGILSHDLCF